MLKRVVAALVAAALVGSGAGPVVAQEPPSPPTTVPVGVPDPPVVEQGGAGAPVESAAADAYAAAVRADDPLSYWRLGEASTVLLAADEEGFVNGVYGGGVTVGQPGVVPGDSAVEFDGSSGHVFLADGWTAEGSHLAPVDELTVEAWFLTTKDDGDFQTIARWRWYGWNLKVVGGQLWADVHGVGGAHPVLSGGPEVADGQWHHAVLTKSATTVTLWLDGVAVDLEELSEQIRYVSAPEDPEDPWDPHANGGGVAIGQEGDDDAYFFEGVIDEVAVYDHALSEERIAAHAVLLRPASLPGGAAIDRMLGTRYDGGYSADPVNTGTGNFYLEETDLAAVAGPSLARRYNSMDINITPDPLTGQPGILGDGWTTGWDRQLVPDVFDDGDPGTTQDLNPALTLRFADGRRIQMASDGQDGGVPPADLRADVVGATLPDLGAVRQVRFWSGEVWTFDRDGRLLREEDGAGHRVDVARSGGFPTSVTSATLVGSSWVAGPSLSLVDENSDGLLDRVADPAGNQVRYFYEDGRLTGVSVPHLAADYPANDPPVAVAYLLDFLGRVEEVRRTVVDGVEPVVATEVVNTYDGFGRVWTQEMPDGEVATFSYGDLTNGTRTTTVTHSWPLQPGVQSEVIQYVHDEQARLIRVVDSTPQTPGSDRVWDEGLLLDRSTRGGADHGYAYDVVGRLVQRAMPDPDTGELPARDPSTGLFPAPGGSDGWAVESFEYCSATMADPRLRRHTDPSGVVTEYRYDPGAASGDPCPAGSMTPTRVVVAPVTDDEMVAGFAVGADGRVRSSTDGDGVTTEWVYGDADPACEDWQLCAVIVAPGTPDQVVTEYRYDPAGRVSSVTEAAGTALAATTTYTYDAAGRVLTETGPLVGVEAGYHPVAYRYDLAGRLVCVSDESNATTAANCNASNASWFYTYDTAGRLVTTRDPDGVVTRTNYVSADREEVTVAHGTPDAATSIYHYGPLGRLAAVVDPEGVASQHCYDRDGNVTATIGGLSSSSGGVPNLVDCSAIPTGALANVTSFDRLGRVTSTTDANGVVTEQRYDRAGRSTHTIAAAGTAAESVTVSVYDSAGRLETTLGPPPNVAAFDWWNTANDPAKLATTRTYTPGGRLEAVTSPNPNRPVVTSDPGLAGLVWDPEVTTTFEYDDAGRQIRVFSPLASLSSTDAHGPAVTTYDAAGRVDTTVSPAGRVTSYERDLLGRVEHIVSPFGDADTLVTSTRHDVLGRVVAQSRPHASVSDPASTLAWEEFAHSPGGRLESVWDPNDQRTDYGYDARGNRVTRTVYAAPDPARLADPSGLGVASVEHWTYDFADRTTAQWREDPGVPGVRHHEITFDYSDPTTGADDGRLRVRADAAGRSETIAYDAARVASRAFTDSTGSYSLTYGYDPAGRQSTVTDSRTPTSPLSRVFDVTGNLLELDDPDGGNLEWLWGAAGNVMRRGGANIEHFYYDLDGRMAQNWGQAGWLILNGGTWTYDPDGVLLDDTYLQAHWANYDPPISYLGRQYHPGDGGETGGYIEASANLETSTWDHVVFTGLSHDSAGRIDGETELTGLPDANGQIQYTLSRDEGYTYDDADQLTGVLDASSDPLVSWTYGPGGQRDTQTTTSDGTAVSPTPVGVADYAWDSIGQLSAVDQPTGDDTTITYDPSGRRHTETTGTIQLTYHWDPAGRLTGRTATDTATTTDLWDETRSYDPTGHLREISHTDHDTGETTTDTVTWDPTTGVAQIADWTHTPDSGAPIGRELARGPSGVPRGDTGALRIWLTDVRGSQIDHWGPTSDFTIAGDTRYTWWGQPLDDTDQPTWLGYRSELTTTSGLIHLRNRDYDPTTATFLSPDPLDSVDGTPTVGNPYHYAHNDPLNMVDPLGLSPGDGGLMEGRAGAACDAVGGRLVWWGDSGSRVCLEPGQAEGDPCWPPQSSTGADVVMHQGACAARTIEIRCARLSNPLTDVICRNAEAITTVLAIVAVGAFTFGAGAAAVVAIGGAAGIAIPTGGLLATAGGGTLGAGAIVLSPAAAGTITSAVSLQTLIHMAENANGGGSSANGDGGSANRGDLKRVNPADVRRWFGIDAHTLKYEVLGRGAQISRYDIYRIGAELVLLEKSTNVLIRTGFTIPGF